MIRARRFAEHRIGEPVIGNEAVVAGIARGIGPDDTVVAGGGLLAGRMRAEDGPREAELAHLESEVDAELAMFEPVG